MNDNGKTFDGEASELFDEIKQFVDKELADLKKPLVVEYLDVYLLKVSNLYDRIPEERTELREMLKQTNFLIESTKRIAIAKAVEDDNYL